MATDDSSQGPRLHGDYKVTAEVRDAGAGLLVETPRDFVGAVERLADDRSLRGRLAAAARAAGVERDWDRLARLYSRILDRHLTLGGLLANWTATLLGSHVQDVLA